ncbi:MAG: hypothetical protein A2788_01555 [Candidatus Abawacabacteria bacterium RIFCSPHIGHO2_01_FULL_46_8]|uniref:Cohesin domain-containing protein n=1 Tax=Candidatus Abawacabacteria bacterium RIFCSPHIGHO2_01_FULL_46_8 TaxID=1817815 RepID=A0A1F4XJW2_9BACT|nr:MAG: hypothetical protein A2788_01555 [Candidatus Abawacabacteria bacterium RIFCSPHIGHO2_01_FULL_46_8]
MNKQGVFRLMVVALIALSAIIWLWWYLITIPLTITLEPSSDPARQVFQVMADTGDQAIDSAHIFLKFPPAALTIEDQDRLGMGVQIIPLTDFDTWQEMKVDQEQGLLSLRLSNQSAQKLKGKINVLTFQAKGQKSFRLKLDCGASKIYTDYEQQETLKARCQSLKVNL